MVDPCSIYAGLAAPCRINVKHLLAKHYRHDIITYPPRSREVGAAGINYCIDDSSYPQKRVTTYVRRSVAL